jgi:transposase
MRRVSLIRLSAGQRRELETILSRRSERAGVVRRARVVLWTAEGVAASEIATRLDLSPEAVSRIRRRFFDGGVAGLAEQPKAGRKDHALPAVTVEKIVQLAPSPPPAGRTRWTTRLLGREVGVPSGTISKVLRSREIKPHRARTYKVSRDPAFTSKVKDIVGLTALEVASGKVTARLSDSHKGADFLAFMNKVVRAYPKQELHVILDNSSTHSTPDVKQ